MQKAELLDSTLSALVLSLGSNDNAMINLTYALDKLATKGNLQCLNRWYGADYTGKSSANYHNLAAVLTLAYPAVGQDMLNWFGKLEQDCGRKRAHNTKAHNYLVALDIDVLAVQTIDCPDFVIIEERYPFKVHEWHCLAGWLDDALR